MSSRRPLVFLLALVTYATAFSCTTRETEERIFENDRLGKIRFVVPIEWETYDRHHFTFGTTVLSGKSRKVEIPFNNVERMKFKWASENELREFIGWQIEQYLDQSVEVKIDLKVERGPNVVVYAHSH